MALDRVPFFIESFLQIVCFEGKQLQNRLRADENELRSVLAVDIQGRQRGGFALSPGWSESLVLIVLIYHETYVFIYF